ncbi:MAG TPA: 50S ribosomal protein L5 [Conexivisphaerales archaeon]|nr:50S ribosomal protein L5 [Conexivisphaerales archaeon]
MAESAQVQEPTVAARVSLGKVVLNIAPGKSGEMVERASKVLETLTGQKPSQRKAKKTVRDFGIHKGEPIAVVVTVRKDRAATVLKDLLMAKSNVVNESSFDDLGNLAFGIKEHIDIPGVKYDPTVGIFGMDVCVSLEKEGLRVGRRRRAQARPGREQRVSKEEAVAFMKAKFGVEIR